RSLSDLPQWRAARLWKLRPRPDRSATVDIVPEREFESSSSPISSTQIIIICNYIGALALILLAVRKSEHQFSFGHNLVTYSSRGLSLADTSLQAGNVDLHSQRVARDNLPAEAEIVDAREKPELAPVCFYLQH